MLNELRVLQHGSTGPVDEEEAELACWRTTVVHGNRTTSRELDLLDRQAILDRLHDVVHSFALSPPGVGSCSQAAV